MALAPSCCCTPALRKGRAKMDIGLARGKHSYDKRDALAERDAKREIAQGLRRRD